tara:strand:- start:5703 stop:6917 length:1215 start_codon:yes stop_codon:yes gene_type:complete
MNEKLYPLHAEGPDLIFGFSTIYFGLLAFAAIVVFLMYRRKGALPKIGEPYYDLMVLVLGMWWLGGLLIDAFAHISGVVDDTFFTPWHAIWYAGATAYGAYMFYAIIPEDGLGSLVRKPLETIQSIAPEHKAGVYGIILFGLSGFGDMIWHETLGVETSVDILLSPAHIGLFIGLMMAVTAPMWSAWADEKSGRDGFKSQVVIVFGLGAAWVGTVLITLYGNIWFDPLQTFCYDGGGSYCLNEIYDVGLSQGMRALLIQAVVSSIVVLLFIRRWMPARGSLFVLFIFPAIGIWVYSEFNNALLLMGIAWAIIVELGLPILQRGRKHLFVPLVTTSQVGVFMVSWLWRAEEWVSEIYWIEGTNLHIFPFGWTIHATFGALVMCAFIGWIVSVIAFPPPIPGLKGD